MSGVPHPKWPAGGGRGHSIPNLEFWEDRPGRNPGTSHVRRDPVSNNFKLHVRSIPSSWNKTIFENVFSKCGNPKNIYLNPHRGPTASFTWGFVEYETYQEAFNAVRELNNNIMLNIQVMFAKERPPEEDVDPILKFLTSQSEEDVMYHGSMESLVNPKTLIKTVKNESSFSSGVLIEDFHKPVFDAETQKCIEEALFHKLLDIYKKDEGSTAKCNVCEASCSLACSGCTTVFYCSEDCQNRDWPSHSRICNGASVGTAEDTGIQSRGSGDHRQTNGFRTMVPETESKFDNRTNRFADRRTNRDSDKVYSREEQNNNDQRTKRNLIEERRARISSGRQNENDGGFQNRFGQNNQRPKNGLETRNSFRPRSNVQADDDDWGSRNQEIQIKKEVEITSTKGKEDITVEKEIKSSVLKIKQETVEEQLEMSAPLQCIEAVNGRFTSEELLLKPGLLLEVDIYHTEEQGSSFWVQKSELKSKVVALSKDLGEHFKACSTQYIPVQDGICGILYGEIWYRCQITSLDPLTVRYIDLGYPETVEANRLFELPSELKTLPPLAFKTKLVDGTTELFLDKEVDTIIKIKIKLIEKVDNSSWSAQVVGDSNLLLATAPGVKATTTEHPPAEVTTPAPAEEVPVQSLQTVPTSVPAEEVPVQPLQTVPTPFPAEEVPPKPLQTVPTVVPAEEVPVQPLQTVPNDLSADGTSSAAQKPYPHMLDVTKYTTVTIVYPVEEGTYFVGAPTVMDTVCQMCAHFQSVIHHCEVQTPQPGKIGLSKFMDQWYRVLIVSVTPKIIAQFIDYGNIESIEPGDFRKCPETHVHIPMLVHKIKLAPGTNEKYFDLPELSQISVKPVTWFSDSTVVVEVEGEQYSKETSHAPEVSTSSTSAPPPEPAPTPEHKASPSTTDFQMDLIPSWPQGTVDFLLKKWKISFVPNKVDFVKNSLLGQVYSEQIPSTFSFMAEIDNFQSYLSSQKFDPDFKPYVGEVVGLRLPSGWERGRVLPQQGLVALNDNGGVFYCSQLFKLPESYTNIPSMAAVLTLSKVDLDLLTRLVNEDEIILDVVDVTRNKERNVVNVSNASLEGVLRAWVYEPLETPNPLAQGELVTISKVINSNTLLVSPANDLEFQQAIQIECRKTNENLEKPPEEGDYVAFLDKESDGYWRCRINRVNRETSIYEIYAIDDATCYEAGFSDLHPLPTSLRNVPCRITQIELKDVEKVPLTEQAQTYVSHIVEEDKYLAIDIDDDGKTTLTIEGEEETLNGKLRKLLKPDIVPNVDGKLTAMSLNEYRVPLNQTYELIVTQTEPLYVQLKNFSAEYYNMLHNVIQDHCVKDNAPYNPCEGELCLAPFEGDWYRCRCLRETNSGTSTLMLVDYGNIFVVQTNQIRRILPEMLTMSSLAISCKIHGLPEHISPALQEKLNETLQPNNVITAEFVEEIDSSYKIVIESLKKAIQELQ